MRDALSASYDPPLDPGIAAAVDALRAAGVETFESCSGDPGHAYAEPTVRFHGDRSEGYRALAVVLGRLDVRELRRVWPVVDGEATGPWWELTFAPTTAERSQDHRRSARQSPHGTPVGRGRVHRVARLL